MVNKAKEGTEMIANTAKAGGDLMLNTAKAGGDLMLNTAKAGGNLVTRSRTYSSVVHPEIVQLTAEQVQMCDLYFFKQKTNKHDN